MLKLSHKKLDTWKESVDLTSTIYRLTSSFPASEKFGLSSQMRRSAASVSSNIAEGASRSSRKERKRFYEIARSSLVELDTQIEIAIKLKLTGGNMSDLEAALNSMFAKLTNQIKNT